MYRLRLDSLPSPSQSKAVTVQILLLQEADAIANSLVAVSDEVGEIRLLDTDISSPTGISNEHLRMHCHDNAIFDISWSYDDMKLVSPLLRVAYADDVFRRQRQETKLARSSIS